MKFTGTLNEIYKIRVEICKKKRIKNYQKFGGKNQTKAIVPSLIAVIRK